MNASMIMGLLALALVGLVAWGLATQKINISGLSIGGLANAFTDGQHDDGRIKFTLKSTLSVRNLAVKAGAATGEVLICGATDMPVGVVQDEGVDGDSITVDLLGGASKTRLGVASAAIAQFARISPAASGKLRTLPTAAGTYWVCGFAVGVAAADGDDIEFAPCVPYQVVVS